LRYPKKREEEREARKERREERERRETEKVILITDQIFIFICI
jgi:hypothetical protein